MHDPSSSKLSVQACEAHWLGVDTDSKVHHVFYSGPENVNVECNIYFGTLAQLEREEDNAPGASSEQAAIPPSHVSSEQAAAPASPSTVPEINPELPTLEDEEQEKEEDQLKPQPPQPHHSERIRKPS